MAGDELPPHVRVSQFTSTHSYSDSCLTCHYPIAHPLNGRSIVPFHWQLGICSSRLLIQKSLQNDDGRQTIQAFFILPDFFAMGMYNPLSLGA
jgi:hypothetical protein